MSEKWWDMSDDELDDLFREASDKVDVPFESSSFDKLRQKMDIQSKFKPTQGFKKRGLLLLAGLFLMVGVGLVYRFGNNLREKKSTKIVENIEKENTVKPTLLSVSPQTTLKTDLKPLSVKTQTTTKEENLTKSSVKTQTTTKKNTVKSTLLSVSPQTTLKTDLKPLSVETQTTTETTIENSEQPLVKTIGTDSQTKVENIDSPNTSEKVVENKPITSKVNDKKAYQIEKNRVIGISNFYSKNANNRLMRVNNSKNIKDREGKNYLPNSQIIEQNISPILENLAPNQEDFLSEENVNRTNFYDVNTLKSKDSKFLSTVISPELPPYVDSLQRVMKSPKYSRFGVRLGLSPDFNSLENLETSALGVSFSLLFEYRISRKLTLQTGISHSKKVYAGEFDYYRNWSFPSRAHPTKPIEVDGGCSVYDLPINLRLNVFQKPKQTWFISGGISSYIMAKENYDFIYDPSTTTPVKQWAYSDNSKFMWSVLNFSMGWEKQIGKHFHIQLEPFVKTPIKGMGRGGVNLYSSGLLFSTKYEF